MIIVFKSSKYIINSLFIYSFKNREFPRKSIIEAVARGIDMFECVIPSRNARHATVFTWNGIMHLTNKCFETAPPPY